MPYDRNNIKLRLSTHSRHICLHVTVVKTFHVNKSTLLTQSHLGQEVIDIHII